MIIQAKELSKEYKVKVKTPSLFRNLFLPNSQTVLAVDHISFTIEKGESVALLGPNGAGKTTSMKMLSGLVYPSFGTVEVMGFTPFDRKREFLMKIALVMGSKTSLDWDLTPAQSFQLFKKIYRITDKDYKERVRLLTNMLDVDKFIDVQVRKLSLGERMKLEIIGAILHNPDILFLDEPTIGLDTISKQKVRDFLRQIQKESNITLLLTSHDMDDIEKVCDRVMVISSGKKVYDDSLEHLTSRYNKERRIKVIFKELPTKDALESLGQITEVGDKYCIIKTSSVKLPELLSKITSNFKIADIDILSVPLDEIISDIYRKNE